MTKRGLVKMTFLKKRRMFKVTSCNPLAISKFLDTEGKPFRTCLSLIDFCKHASDCSKFPQYRSTLPRKIKIEPRNFSTCYRDQNYFESLEKNQTSLRIASIFYVFETILISILLRSKSTFLFYN